MIKSISSSRFTHVYFDPSSHDRLCVSGLQSTQQDHPDIFADLGPVYFFNAMCALVERRTHTVMISETDGFGLRLSGGNPVRVSDVVYGGPAAAAGMKCGDYIIEIGDVDVRSRLASEVEAELVKAAAAGGVAKIVVVVNYDMQNFEELINPEVPSTMMLSPEKVSDANPCADAIHIYRHLIHQSASRQTDSDLPC